MVLRFYKDGMDAQFGETEHDAVHTDEQTIGGDGPATGLTALETLGQIPTLDAEGKEITNSPSLPQIETFDISGELAEISLPDARRVTIEIHNMRGTDQGGSPVALQLSSDGGSSWISASDGYAWARRQHHSDGTDDSGNSTADSEIELVNNYQGNNARRATPWTISIADPFQDALATHLEWSGVYNGILGTVSGAGRINSPAGTDTLRLYHADEQAMSNLSGRVITQPVPGGWG